MINEFDIAQLIEKSSGLFTKYIRQTEVCGMTEFQRLMDGGLNKMPEFSGVATNLLT